MPICEEPTVISIHFTSPKADVIYEGPSSGTLDIAADNDKETGETIYLSKNSSQIRVAQVSNISISYDIAKLDDLTAARFLKKLNFYLNDPELLLL